MGSGRGPERGSAPARVYVSVLGPDDQWTSSLAALDRARGYIRSWLTPRLRLRVVPQISFHPDRSMAHAAHIQKLLADLRPAEPESGPEGGEAEATGDRPRRGTEPDQP